MRRLFFAGNRWRPFLFAFEIAIKPRPFRFLPSILGVVSAHLRLIIYDWRFSNASGIKLPLNDSGTDDNERTDPSRKGLAEMGTKGPCGTVERLRRALEAAGVEFTNGGQPGVRLKASGGGTIAADELNASNDE
jgi:hypothetical protein